MITIESKYPKISEKDIENWQKINLCTIPNTFKVFLLKYNVAEITPNVFDVPDRGRFALSNFFGLTNDINGLSYVLETFVDRIPKKYFPIGRDINGNLLLIGNDLKKNGKIYFWNHEEENIVKINETLNEFINNFYEINFVEKTIYDKSEVELKEILSTNWNIDSVIEGKTLIQNAVLKNQLEIVKILINKKANLAGCIHYAITSENLTILELLLESGANIEEKNNLNYTPLQTAILEKKDAILQLLLRFKADKNIVNEFGRSPLEIAQKMKNRGENMDNIINTLTH